MIKRWGDEKIDKRRTMAVVVGEVMMSDWRWCVGMAGMAGMRGVLLG